jgi:hypothetical protein
VEYCTCGHTVTEHLHGTGHCRSDDTDGERCACHTFDTEADTGRDCP